MEFRDLQRQYQYLKEEIDGAIFEVLQSGRFISGSVVRELEEALAQFVGRRHCITCGNGTDALELALRALDIGPGDAVFVPDFTFFASGEVVSTVGAMPVFVDVEPDTYNLSVPALKAAVSEVAAQGKYRPGAVIAVDLFGQPAEYGKICQVTKAYGMYLIEDGAQGFGGCIGDRAACSFGDIATTSFFPAKPLGCYGDGGAIFTDNDGWDQKIRSLCVHGKSSQGKYDNIQIGMNSRLDSIQAAVLKVKLAAFRDKELEQVDKFARIYTQGLKDLVGVPHILPGYGSSWAQYTIRLDCRQERAELQKELGRRGIPTMIYYWKAMHEQQAFTAGNCQSGSNQNTVRLCETVLSLPMSPYMLQEECDKVIENIREILTDLRRKSLPESLDCGEQS